MVWIATVVVLGVLVGIGTLANVRARTSLPRRLMPRTRELIGLAHIVWGTVTALVFVPAGLVLALLAFDGARFPAFGVFLTAVCLSGLVFARRTLMLPRALEAEDTATVARVAVHGVAHHVAVLGVFALGFLIEPFDFRAILAPCAIGVALAVAAARQVELDVPIPRAAVHVKKL